MKRRTRPQVPGRKFFFKSVSTALRFCIKIFSSTPVKTFNSKSWSENGPYMVIVIYLRLPIVAVVAVTRPIALVLELIAGYVH